MNLLKKKPVHYIDNLQTNKTNKMDSRDIKENPTITTGYLEDIYKMQRGLLDHYISIEGLPPYPVDVNTKASQTLLKDFTSRVVEELAEGMEAFYLVSERTQANKLWHGNVIVSEYTAMLNHLQNVGEEMADALHFFVELLIYANIQPEDIISWVQKEVGVAGEPDMLKRTMIAGLMLLMQQYDDFNGVYDQNTVNILKPIQDGDIMYKESLDQRFLICGSKLNVNLTPYLKQIAWDITYHLNISRNFLKNKPWKQSQVMTSEVQYQKEVVRAFVLFLGFLNLWGCTPETVYFLYFKKNHVNQFRIKSKY